MLKAMKEGALALAAKAWLKERFSDYGEVVDCRFDTQGNTLTIEALLRGEQKTITARIDRYELEKTGDQHFVILKKFSSSRAWLTTLLNALLIGKRYKIPAVVSKLL